MKNASFLRLRTVFFVVLAWGAATLGSAQTATFTADTTALAPGGGRVALTATVTYEQLPGALGWSIVLPADWSLLSVSGDPVPGIAPEVGSSGTLEFAYFTIPAQRAEFKLVVQYPAGATTAKAVPTVLVRANGKLLTLEPSPVTFGARP